MISSLYRDKRKLHTKGLDVKGEHFFALDEVIDLKAVGDGGTFHDRAFGYDARHDEKREHSEGFKINRVQKWST